MSRSHPTRRRTTLLAAGLVAAAGLPLAAASAPPASARSIVVHDPAGDLRFVSETFTSGDLRRIRVTHGPHRLAVLFQHARGSGTTDIYLAYLDLDPRNPGPEYRVSAGAEVESASVTRVDDFGLQGGTPVPCRGADVDFAFGESPAPVRIVVPRSCIGSPDRFRASLATQPDYPFKNIDWAPGVRTFGRWVISGPVARPVI